MKNNNKTREQLLKELEKSNAKIAELEKSEVERKKSEEKEKELQKNIRLLSEITMKFVELSSDTNIYSFIGEKIRELVGKDSYVIVNSVDEKQEVSTTRAVLGAGKFIDKITKFLGKHPVGMSVNIQSDNMYYMSNCKMHLYTEGLYGILLQTVPKAICTSIEKLMKVDKIYTIDFIKGEQLLGTAVVFLKESAEEIKNIEIIETFIKQASIAIQQRLAEEALRESETRYKNLYSMMRLMSDNLPDLIWTKDMEGKFLFVNKACSEILLDARDTDEPIGKTDIYFADRMMKSRPEIPDYLSFGKKCVESDLAVLKTRKPMRFDESGNVKGKFLYLDVYKAPFYDENGEMIGTVGCGRVVTRERQMEKTLQESEQRFRKLLENVPTVAVQGYNTDGVIHYWNKANESIYGYTAEEAIGKNLVDLIIPPDMKEDVRKIIKHGAKIGEMPPAAEMTLMRKDGKPVTVFTSHAVVQQSGKEPELFCIDVDLTERKKAEEELAKHREHLEELVKERTKELDEKNKELKRYNKLFEGREFRIKELRDKVKELKKKVSS